VLQIRKRKAAIGSQNCRLSGKGWRVPLLSVLLLLLVIPFPAYRYAYPSVVMVTLLERWHSPARLHAGIRSS